MAATISVNFASEQEVYLEQPPDKKSVSAKLLSEVLGGGIVSGGYVKRTGDSMTGFLTLTGIMPTRDYHAVPKRYVDDHAYTRRYYYECAPQNIGFSGFVPANSVTLSGSDLNTNLMYFFEASDTPSLDNLGRYIDVYRNGILQVYGSNKDYILVSNNSLFNSATAVQFAEPFQPGETFQISIGSQGAYPITFGLYRVYEGFAIRTNALSGDVTLSVITSAFASTRNQVKLRNSGDTYVSPVTLSAYPLIVKASGLFRKAGNYLRTPDITNLDPPYGNENGEFSLVEGTGVISAFSKPPSLAGETPSSTRIRVNIDPKILENTNYNVQVHVYTNDSNPENCVLAAVDCFTGRKTTTSFDFIVYTSLLLEPEDITEFSVLIY